VKLNITTINEKIPDDVKEKLTESKNLLSKSIQDLRDIARSLNPDFLSEIGLTGAIEQQLQLLEKTGQYKTSFTINGDVYKNDQQHELVTFRIVQELLNNIVKHAEANTVNIKMSYLPDKLTITVEDNGKGFDVSSMQSAENNRGLGLRNMMNRMALINGSIKINSNANEGTNAAIELPK
jgi:signal transduction histidine kinase